jgi:hypothetical protein
MRRVGKAGRLPLILPAEQRLKVRYAGSSAQPRFVAETKRQVERPAGGLYPQHQRKEKPARGLGEPHHESAAERPVIEKGGSRLRQIIDHRHDLAGRECRTKQSERRLQRRM